VRSRVTISNLLAALAVLGLLAAPLVRPAMAAMMHTAAEHAAMDMPAGMPCCPDQMPGKDCAKDCPLMATCVATSLQAMPAGATLFTPPETAGILLPASDADPAGLSTGPPQRPPKT
jgi:hypothetical protein